LPLSFIGAEDTILIASFSRRDLNEKKENGKKKKKAKMRTGKIKERKRKTKGKKQEK